MRVIAGKYKGRKINPPVDNTIRPTTDKIKEALFGILQNETEGAVVIDLFAGTGSLGIEALSRGAKKVYFCDIDSHSIGLLKSNLSFCDKSEYEILKGDFSDCLRRLSMRGIKADIILCDPPYKFKLGDKILNIVKETQILSRGGTVTVERAEGDGVLNEAEFFLESTRKYGNISIDIFKNYTKAAVTGTFDPFTNGHKFLVEEGLKQFDAVYVAILINENKTAEYSAEKRIKIIETALRQYKRRIKVEFYDGFAADYCVQRGIKYIIRGIRTPKDAEYEREMAEYNFSRGGVETLFIPAERPEISSTAVKEKLKSDEDIGGMVDNDIIKMLVK